jgi:hypothetical protein
MGLPDPHKFDGAMAWNKLTEKQKEHILAKAEFWDENGQHKQMALEMFVAVMEAFLLPRFAPFNAEQPREGGENRDSE